MKGMRREAAPGGRIGARPALLALILMQPLTTLPATPRAAAQPAPPPRAAPSRPAEKQRLTEQVERQFDDKNYTGAEATLRELTALDARNFVGWYNLACALSMQGRKDEAAAALGRAVSLGFSDLRQLRSDTHLVAARDTAAYRELIASWADILDARVEANITAAREAFGRGYRFERDENLRLAYISAFDPEAFALARKEIDLLVRWWETEVAPPQPQPPPAPAPATAPPPTPWVIVILPTGPDYARWAQRQYGAMWEQVGGAYNDDEKRLVAKDLGPTLRHEFWHVLHWRDMRARGQIHPTWVQEGLCSLVEDCDAGPGGEMTPLPSWRTNTARRLAKNGGLTPWAVLFAKDQGKFVGSRPLAHYAEARAVFLFLAQRGRLRDFYAAYTAGFREDPTGARALEQALGRPLAQAQGDFRAWLRALPDAPDEETATLPVTLPFRFDPGGGDGLVVAEPVSGTPAGVAGLRLRDVLTSIAGRPVRDESELARALAGKLPGDTVEVEYRRGANGKVRGKATLTLIAPPRTAR